MSPPNVCLFVSVGRCGTQWLATSLGHAYSDVAWVTHEPIGPWYRSREWLRAYDRIDGMLALPLVGDHLQDVSRTIESKTYIETGWPSYSAIPLFIRQFGDRVRLVQLTRHPVHNAMSYVSLIKKWTLERWEQSDWVRFALPDPSSSVVRQHDYEAHWPTLSAYEKALFWWTEIHLYAEDIFSRFPDIPRLRITFEELFGRDDGPMRSLIDFLGLSPRQSIVDMRETRVDAYHFPMSLDFDWRAVFAHPTTVGLSERLGYDLNQIDESAVRHRYRRSFYRLGNLLKRRVARGPRAGRSS